MGFPKLSIQGTANLYLSNICISFASVLLTGLNVFQFDDILNIGKFSSISIYLIVGIEIARWVSNTFCLKVVASSPTSLRSNARKPIPFFHIKTICKLATLLIGFILAYAAVCILMGAPLQANQEETFVLSVMLTSLTILPIAVYLGPNGTLQYLFYDAVDLNSRNEIALLEYLQQNAVAALIGAWSGSVVAPLDWDRAWQAYPIPNMIGGLVGLALSNVYTLLLTGLAAFVSKKNVGKAKKNI